MISLKKRLRRALPLVAALAVLPLPGDADNNNCCNAATSFSTTLFASGSGDESFLSLPSSPNLMFLLGNSMSMLDFPNPVPANMTALLAATNMDACVQTPESATTRPFDWGFGRTSDPAPMTDLVSDDPPWGASCTGNGCLFTPDAFYLYTTRGTAAPFVGNIGIGSDQWGAAGSTIGWSTASATSYSAANACALTNPANGIPRVRNATACVTCLTSTLGGKSGYYQFVDQSTCRIQGGTVNCGAGNSTPSPSVIFRGSYLNANPPKYVMARKAIKDLARVDTSRQTTLDAVRMGLAVLRPKTSRGGQLQSTSFAADDGGQLVVPLGPSCAKYPVERDDVVAVRTALIAAVNGVSFGVTGTNTESNQLAEALYNVGQYYSNAKFDDLAAASPVRTYARLFGSSWVYRTDDKWDETSTGQLGSDASWISPTATSCTESGCPGMSFCNGCQQSSILIVSDGQVRNDNNVPLGSGAPAAHATLATSTGGGADFVAWTNSKISCSAAVCGNDPAGRTNSPTPNLLHKVAAFLYDFGGWYPSVTAPTGDFPDLRPDLPGVQNVRTHALSFGIEPSSQAARLLQRTAELGGGAFFNEVQRDTTTGALVRIPSTKLEDELYVASQNVDTRATTFSAAAMPSVQTAESTQLFLARFQPTARPAWKGHLYRFRLWNEFAQGCDGTRASAGQTATCVKGDGTEVTLNPNLNGDESGEKAVCSDVWIIDDDCDLVAEGSQDGKFYKADFVAGVLTPRTGNVLAVPAWDAGKVLADRTTSRNIYTVVNSTDSGRFDTRVAFDTTGTTWPKLRAALGVDPKYCARLFEKMTVFHAVNAAGEVDAAWDPSTPDGIENCAKQVVHYTRGWDIFDEDQDGCAGPGFPRNVGACTGERRAWPLGDIQHSSPVVVNPPATTLACDLALDTQCVSTLRSPAIAGTVPAQIKRDYPITSASGTTIQVDAYEKYRRVNANRKRIVLVGANDGMLHAFDAGNATGGSDALGSFVYDEGTGEELWAFIPPDLLPKLKNALFEHTYFVDGNTMVRDVWKDGSGTASGTPDGIKQADEFHTIAVLTERSGGIAYVALDVTNTASPRFLWMYPDACSLDVTRMGQSWSDFAPRPPPIGPVKFAGSSMVGPDATRGFQERWIVMVNGGYDPSLTRGRGIWMMDAWTGQKVWSFTNDDYLDGGYVGNGKGGMWPVPGAVGLLDVGALDSAQLKSDGFFDTATWGDIGGQVFIARFDTPDATKWAAARAFEENRQADDSQPIAGRSEFYLMTANTVDPATGYLHTYLGSGNRERLLLEGGCGPDNVLGCFQAGCNGFVKTSYDYGSCSYDVFAHATRGEIRQNRSSTSTTACDEAGISCGGVSVKIQLQLVCGTSGNPQDFHASLTCDASGRCSEQVSLRKGNKIPSQDLSPVTTKSRFYGIWSYGGRDRTFSDLASATTFDANRFTDVAFTGCAATATATTPGSCRLVDTTYAQVAANGTVTGNQASSYSPGWLYEYGHHDACSMGTGCDAADWIDEKTASGASILSSCVTWNSFRKGPATGATSCSAGINLARNFTYFADYVRGVPSPTCGMAGASSISRARMRDVNVPPNPPTPQITLSKTGEIVYSMSQIEAGSPPQSSQVGTGSETNQMIYWLEVPRSLHACRHDNPERCE